MPRAIYSGSFDPVTFGHLDIIERAARVFDDLEVVVGNHPAKRYVFSLEERVGFLRQSIGDPRVRVRKIEHQLLADYAYEAGVRTIVKGVRGIQDYDHERMMHEINLTQQRGIDTHILLSRKDLDHVSSSAVKELCRFQGFTHEYVPLVVKEALERRLNEQIIIGVTGGIGCGKSTLARGLVATGTRLGLAVHDLDLDQVAHGLLEDRPESAYRDLRAQVCAAFGMTELKRKALGEFVFNHPAELARLNEIMRVPLLTRLRAGMVGKRGVILLNAALLAEADLLHLCNNRVLLVTADEDVRLARLRARGLSAEQIGRRLASQYTTEEKRLRIAQRIRESRHGRCEEVVCNRPTAPAELEALLRTVSAEAGSTPAR